MRPVRGSPRDTISGRQKLIIATTCCGSHDPRTGLIRTPPLTRAFLHECVIGFAEGVLTCLRLA